MSPDDRPWLGLVLLLILVNRAAAWQPGFDRIALGSAGLALLVCLVRLFVVSDES